MSLPQFPNRDNLPTRDEAINQIISSIAMEELGLSHIINAEGEKIQYVLGTIPDVAPLATPPTIDDLLKINQSVRDTLDTTVQNQMFLRGKLQNALTASTLVGPTGPTGPAGPPIDPDTTILTVGDGVEEVEVKFQDTIEFESDTLDITVENGATVKIEDNRVGGSIIPYSSGTTVTMVTNADGSMRSGVVCIFGMGAATNLANPIIDIESTAGEYCFSMPSDGRLTSIALYFSATSGGHVTSPSYVVASIFKSTTPDNLFERITETDLALQFDEIVTQRVRRYASKPLNIPLEANTRLFIAVYLISDATEEVTMRGYPSGSVGIVLD